MRLYSWNINGYRAAVTRGLLTWLQVERPDVLCLQETKVDPAGLPVALRQPDGYTSQWAAAERPGYSGVATFSRLPVHRWQVGLGLPRFDVEGRVLVTELGGITLYNVYVPNGKASPQRLAYKLDFYAALLDQVDTRTQAGQAVLVCGDFNTAHQPIDLARPRENATVSGFLPEERVWLDRWVEHGWVDSFRNRYPKQAGAYTWWSPRTHAHARNVGWRVDYIFVHRSLLPRVRDAGIAAAVTGSDHCPVWLDLAD